MKKLTSKLVLLVAFVVAATAIQANAPLEKSKVIEKDFSINANTLIDIDNKYGKVHISTWDKNSVHVKVTVKATSKTEEKAAGKLNDINVNFVESPQALSMVTDLKTMKAIKVFAFSDANNESFSIDYEVSMPKTNPLQVDNSFGDVFLPDFDGRAKLNIRYGKLKAQNINHKESDVQIRFGEASINNFGGSRLDFEYSKAAIENTNNAKVEEKFSELKINTCDNLDLVSEYGKVKIEKLNTAEVEEKFSEIEITSADAVHLSSRYGEFTIREINSIEGDSRFTDFDIQNLNKRLKLDIEYGDDFEIDNISAQFELIDIKARFCDFKLNFASSSSYQLESYMKFGELDYPQQLANFNHPKDDDSNSQTIVGRIGKAESNARVKLDIQYGDVDLIYK